MPGKVPRGSLPHSSASTGFTPLARAILDKLDRGVVLLDIEGRVVDSNAIARYVLAKGNGLMVRNDRLSFADGDIDSRFEQLLQSSGKLRQVERQGARNRRHRQAAGSDVVPCTRDPGDDAR